MSVRDLTILGTSAQQPTRKRNHGGYLLRWNGEGFLFDPGEGTQRQFIFADIAPTVVTRIFISHFHGDHCLGLGSMIMRLNLDKVKHPIHCYYPASGKVYFDRLRYATMYREHITIVEHPVEKDGIVEEGRDFMITASFLDHGVETVAWRITEPTRRKYDKDKLNHLGVKGPLMKELSLQGVVTHEGKTITLKEVSWMEKGDTFAIIMDTRFCQKAIKLAEQATLLLCESTYLHEHKELAYEHHHMTATQAATIAQQAEVKMLVLTHFSGRYLDSKPFEDEARLIFKESYAAEDLKRFPFIKTHTLSLIHI